MRSFGVYPARSHAEAFRNLLADVYGEDGKFAVAPTADPPPQYAVTAGVEKHFRNFQLVQKAFDAGLLAGQDFPSRHEQVEARHLKAAAEGLERAREDEADRVFTEHDFGELTVEDSNGWEHVLGGEEWTKVFFAEDPYGGDSIRHTFTVRFRKGSADVAGSCCH